MIVKIYSEKEISADRSKNKATIESYIIDKTAPNVLICPGGAYALVADFIEGKPIAEKLNELGFNAFVITYRVGLFNAKYPNPFEDLARSVRILKSENNAFGIKVNKYALFGSSAGGHLCALFSVKHAEFETDFSEPLKPDSLVLSYPVITMGELTHSRSKKLLLGGNANKEKCEKASVEKIAENDFPPTFVWQNKDDKSVDYHNSVMLSQRLEEKSVPCVLTLYNKGGHGIGLGTGKEAEGWINSAAEFIKQYI